MKTKKLKLPDGGTFDLPVPAGFGESSLIVSTQTGRTARYIVGAVGGAVTGVLIIYLAEKIAALIERRA